MKTENIPPSQTFPDLFKKVHELHIFSDAKTMSDAIPKTSSKSINEAYKNLKDRSKENLARFVNLHFEISQTVDSGFISDKTLSVKDHINKLWSVLKREKDDYIEGSSLIPLPYPYIVPGGRFNEIYYWDSYFTMLGLRVSGHSDIIENMIDNFTYQIDLFGHIPNGNRSYFISRSQPPFFALMIELLAEIKGPSVYEKYLDALVKEHSYWMRNSQSLDDNNNSSDRIALTERGYLLNRYWDDINTPRDEMYPDDVELSKTSSHDEKVLYRHLRSACESGWDFSARWFSDPMDLGTIEAGNILPVDLNCLLFQLEKTISKAYDIQKNTASSQLYDSMASNRNEAILNTFWNEREGTFFDYNFVDQKQTSVYSLAGVFPLFFNLVDQKKADQIADVIESKFLRPGGLVSTPIQSGQQWDAPNGWAPLQYVAIKGLINYGHKKLARDISQRWLTLNESVFKKTGKMMEKYNVEDLSLDAGGGEYPVQDGFGWSNGVYLALQQLIK